MLRIREQKRLNYSNATFYFHNRQQPFTQHIKPQRLTQEEDGTADNLIFVIEQITQPESVRKLLLSWQSMTIKHAAITTNQRARVMRKIE